MMIVKGAFVSVTKSAPQWLVTAVQAAFSCLVPFLLSHLALLVAHLTPLELAYIYIPGTGLYFAGLKEAEKKWPNVAWIFLLLPTRLPA
jgi:hypothetical protein